MLCCLLLLCNDLSTNKKEEHFNIPWPVPHCLIACCEVIFYIKCLFWNASLEKKCAASCYSLYSVVNESYAKPCMRDSGLVWEGEHQESFKGTLIQGY